jgi:hypothetical protein
VNIGATSVVVQRGIPSVAKQSQSAAATAFVANALQVARLVEASMATNWLDSALMLNPNRFDVIPAVTLKP